MVSGGKEYRGTPRYRGGKEYRGTTGYRGGKWYRGTSRYLRLRDIAWPRNISVVRDIAGPRCTCEMRDIAEHRDMSKVRDFVRIWMGHEIVSIKWCNTAKSPILFFPSRYSPSPTNAAHLCVITNQHLGMLSLQETRTLCNLLMLALRQSRARKRCDTGSYLGVIINY